MDPPSCHFLEVILLVVHRGVRDKQACPMQRLVAANVQPCCRRAFRCQKQGVWLDKQAVCAKAFRRQNSPASAHPPGSQQLSRETAQRILLSQSSGVVVGIAPSNLGVLMASLLDKVADQPQSFIRGEREPMMQEPTSIFASNLPVPWHHQQG